MNLKEQIDKMKIIDDHVHAFNDVYWREVVGDIPFAFEFDKLDVPSKMMTIARAKTLATAYHELYDFPYSTITPDNEPELDKLYQRSKSDEASVYHRALKSAGIEYALEICLSNPELPPGLNPQYFKRVAYLDGLIIPLDNTEFKKASKQANVFVSMAEAFAKSVHKQFNCYPKSFEDYLNFLSTVIEKLQEQGCIAIKLNHAYWRDIAVDVVNEDEARNVFESKDVNLIRYKCLQDFLIRQIIAKAAELDLPIQIHSGGIGPERSMKEGDPSCLDGFLWLPDLRQAKVVLLHGGYPLCREAGFMVSRMWNQRRTCLDISWMWWGHFSSPNALVGILREWLEMGIVRRLIYGSDAGNPHQLWMSAMNMRQALYLALKGMIHDGLLNEDQALSMAELVLRGNAKTLYKL
jgi:predicted TIM-barrel fold metal-dependent hydrolase